MNAALPDLAASMAQRRDASGLRLRLERTSAEMASGRRVDLVAGAGGDPARLFAIERARALALRDAEGLALAEGRASVTQAALAKMQTLTDTLGIPLLAALGRGDMNEARLHADAAAGALSSAVQTLNERFAGRALFAGAAVDGAAIASADVILAAVAAEIAAAPDAAAALAAVDAWFDDAGGGFETVAWLGDPADAARAGFDEGDVETVAVRGDAPELRAVVKAFTLAALAAEDVFAGPPGTAPALLHRAATLAVATRDTLVAMRADLGLAEQRLEGAAATAAGRRNALELSWNAATLRDPYEAAAEFQALETQLMTVFNVTARLSRLTLNDFLR